MGAARGLCIVNLLVLLQEGEHVLDTKGATLVHSQTSGTTQMCVWFPFYAHLRADLWGRDPFVASSHSHTAPLPWLAMAKTARRLNFSLFAWGKAGRLALVPPSSYLFSR